MMDFMNLLTHSSMNEYLYPWLFCCIIYSINIQVDKKECAENGKDTSIKKCDPHAQTRKRSYVQETSYLDSEGSFFSLLSLFGHEVMILVGQTYCKYMNAFL